MKFRRSAGSVMAAIEHNESFDGSAPDPGEELVGQHFGGSIAAV